MVSVVLSDYVQFVVLSFGLLLTTYLAVNHVGWENILQTVQTELDAKGFDPTISEGAFGWQYVVWMVFLGMVRCGVWPTAVARVLAMESPELVKRQYMFASISYLIRFLIPYFWGICAFVFIIQTDSLRAVFYPAGYPIPDPLPDGMAPLDRLYAMPVFLGKILPTGIIGIITAGMVAAFMSTHDSYLLCWSSVLTQDVVVPICETLGRPLRNKTRITLSRMFIIAIGWHVLYWGLIYQGKDDIWDYMAITGAIYFTGAFAVLLGGLYWKRASSAGAFLALLSGLTAILGLGPIRERVAESLSISLSGSGVGLFSIGIALAVLVAGSLLFPDKRTTDTIPVRGRTPVAMTKAATLMAALVAGLLIVVARYNVWQQLWTAVLIIGVLLFALLAVTVTVGGAADVRKLFRALEPERKKCRKERSD